MTVSEPVRVLHMIGGLNAGGSQSMVLNLYHTIDRSKVQFDFVIDHHDHIFLAPEIERLGGHIYRVPWFRGWNLPEVVRAWNDLLAEHSEYKVFHTHVRSYASVFLPIAKKYGCQTIAHSHNTSNGGGLMGAVKDAMQLPVRKQADYLFACSEKAGIWMYGKKACKGDNFRVIRNAIDLDLFRYNEQKRMALRKDLGVEDSFVIGHVGRMSAQKNHKYLLELFRLVKDHKPDSKLLLLGDGELRAEVEIDIDKLGLRKDVLLLGSRSNVCDYYQAMDVFILPSLWEGLPVTAIEAQASGLPCLFSDQVTRDAAVTDLCRFIPLSESEQWIDALLAVPKQRTDTGLKIREAGYDIHETAKWFEEFYLRLQNDAMNRRQRMG